MNSRKEFANEKANITLWVLSRTLRWKSRIYNHSNHGNIFHVHRNVINHKIRMGVMEKHNEKDELLDYLWNKAMASVPDNDERSENDIKNERIEIYEQLKEEYADELY